MAPLVFAALVVPAVLAITSGTIAAALLTDWRGPDYPEQQETHVVHFSNGTRRRHPDKKRRACKRRSKASSAHRAEQEVADDRDDNGLHSRLRDSRRGNVRARVVVDRPSGGQQMRTIGRTTLPVARMGL
jgi:hypothetical protein